MWQISATITAPVIKTLRVTATQLSTRNIFQCNCIAASVWGLCSSFTTKYHAIRERKSQLSLNSAQHRLVMAGRQVTLRVSDDVDVDVTSGAPEEPQLVVAGEGSADAEVFNADFAGAPQLRSPALPCNFLVQCCSPRLSK